MYVDVPKLKKRESSTYGKYDLELVARESGYKSSVCSTLLEYPDSRATSKRWYDCTPLKSD